jgi:hypothetical protein
MGWPGRFRQAFGQGPGAVVGSVLRTRNMMRAQRVFCIAALALMAASLVIVALDEAVFPGVDHRPGTCPICSWATSLASSVLPALVIPIEAALRWWMPPEPSSVFCEQLPRRLFFARGPPLLHTA